jgi:hypothetical protein
MNEKLKQIALECYNPYSNFDHEKFAKMIVEECMSNLHLHGYDDAMNQVKQHFGVEDA